MRYTKKYVRIATLFVMGVMVIASCTSTFKQTTESYGVENTAYLEIVGQAYNSVQVSIDDGERFTVNVNKNKKGAPVTSNKYTYKIPVGAHDIVVTADEKTLVSRKIYTSVGEVNIVEIP